MIARVFDGVEEGLTRDDVLDNITLYWLTNTGVSSARLYWENKFNFIIPKNVTIPVAVSSFPDDLDAPPRSWAEKAYPNLIFFNKHDKGGHEKDDQKGAPPVRTEQSPPTHLGNAVVLALSFGHAGTTLARDQPFRQGVHEGAPLPTAPLGEMAANSGPRVHLPIEPGGSKSS